MTTDRSETTGMSNADDPQRFERALAAGALWQVLSDAGLETSDLDPHRCAFTVTLFGTKHEVIIADHADDRR